MSQEPTYRVGIIGTGRIASTIQDEIADGPFHFLLPYSHAGAYAAVPTTRVVAAADTDPARRDEFARRWQVPAVYADHRDMLARERLDIVSICTPTRSHCQVALDVAAAGVRGVFLEKPIAQNLRDADRIIAAFEERGIAAAVNHMRTYDVYYRRVRQLVERDAIGTLHVVMAHWHEGMLFGGTHLFDALRFLVGAEADWVFGRLDQGDGVFDRGGSGMVRFANGVDAFINNRTGHAAPSEFDLVGSAGRIRLGNTLYPELYTRDERAPASGLARRVFPGALVAKSGMTVAVEELLAAIEQGTKPGSDLRDARADLELALAFDCSDRERRPVQLPLTDLDLTIEDPWGRG